MLLIVSSRENFWKQLILRQIQVKNLQVMKETYQDFLLNKPLLLISVSLLTMCCTVGFRNVAYSPFLIQIGPDNLKSDWNNSTMLQHFQDWTNGWVGFSWRQRVLTWSRLPSGVLWTRKDLLVTSSLPVSLEALSFIYYSASPTNFRDSNVCLT